MIKIKSILTELALLVFSISTMTGCDFSDTEKKSSLMGGSMGASLMAGPCISYTLPANNSSAAWQLLGLGLNPINLDFQINSNFPITSVENAALVSGNTYRITIDPNANGTFSKLITATNSMNYKRQFRLNYSSAIDGYFLVPPYWLYYHHLVTWNFKDFAYRISLNDLDADNAQTAMDNSGNTIDVWVQNSKIFKSEYRNGVWTHPTSISDCISPTGGPARLPQVAMDDNGNAIIVWSQYDGSYYRMFKSEYRNGVWNHPATTANSFSPTGNHAIFPQVAMGNNGDAIIVWEQAGVTVNGYIYKSEFRNGTWTHPSGPDDIINNHPLNAYNPQVVMDDNGNAIIVWEQEDDTRALFQIFKSEYRNGSWTFPTGGSDYISLPGKFAQSPQVAISNNGSAIIVWRQLFLDGSSQERIYKSEYRNGAWVHPASFSDRINPTESVELAEDPKVAMDDSGNAVIVWEQTGHIFKSEYRSGVWVHPANANSFFNPSGSSASKPFVSMDNTGKACITWIQSDGTKSQVFKSEYGSGAWLHPSGVTDNISPDGQNAVNARLTCNNGKTVILWTEPEGDYNQIFMAEYPKFR